MGKTSLRKPVIALLLSLVFPGLGQAYNRQLPKAVLFSAAFPAFFLISGALELPHSLAGLLVHLVVLWCLILFILGDALWYARKPKNAEHRTRKSWPAYGSLAVLLSFNLFAEITGFYLDKVLGIHAYRIPAESMLPTIRSGERIIADTRYYPRHSPRRGDVVVLQTPPFGSLTLKRVIAMPGNVITGEASYVYVNGQHVNEPYIQPLSDDEVAAPDPTDKFGPLTIPENHLFVMGDNRYHSFDSRHSGFGLVRIEQIKAKPLYIYWSSDRARIGKKIQ
jgi:signal peptidase I